MKNHSYIALGLLTVASLLFTVFSSSAAVIVAYEFTSNALTPSIEDPLVSASAISAGSLTLFESTTTNTRGFPTALFSGDNHGVLQVRSGGSYTITDALKDERYFELTIQPTDEISFTNVTFNAGSTGASQPRMFYLYADSGNGFDLLGNSGALVETSVTSANIDLSSLSGITHSIDFRFYVVDGATSGTRTLGITDIVFNGAVIPEPRSVALVIAGLIFIIIVRRKS